MKTEQTGTPYTVDQMIEAIQLVMTECDRLKAVNAEMLEGLKSVVCCCFDNCLNDKKHSDFCNEMSDKVLNAINKAEAL